MHMKKFITLLLLFASITVMSQTVYITETGKCYHKSQSCGSIVNKISIATDSMICVNYGLTPCKKCYSISTSSAGIDSGTKTITGKTIWIGPKGGKYWLDDAGNKHYIPKS